MALSGMASSADRLAIPRSASREATFFVVLLYFGLHTGVPIAPNGILLVPYVFSFTGALGLLYHFPHRFDKPVLSWFAQFSAIILVLGLVTAARYGSSFHHLRSSLLFVYSAFIGYAAFVGLTEMGARQVEKVFFWVSLTLIIGSALELYGPLKPASDWFRANSGSAYGGEMSVVRDVLNYGGIRPCFFAPEPSILGTSMGFSLCLWLGAKKDINVSNVWLVALVTLGGFIVIRSPNVIFGPVAVLLIYLSKPTDHSDLVRFAKKALIAFYALAVVLIPFISLYAVLYMASAPRYILTMSYVVRIIMPCLMFLNAVPVYPVTGIGLGNDALFNGIALKVFYDTGAMVLLGPRAALGMTGLICNSFWEFWIFFGLVGGAIIVWTLHRFTKILKISLSGFMIFVVSAGTFWLGFGSLNVLAWFSVFMVAAISALRQFDRQSQGVGGDEI